MFPFEQNSAHSVGWGKAVGVVVIVGSGANSRPYAEMETNAIRTVTESGRFMLAENPSVTYGVGEYFICAIIYV